MIWYVVFSVHMKIWMLRIGAYCNVKLTENYTIHFEVKKKPKQILINKINKKQRTLRNNDLHNIKY